MNFKMKVTKIRSVPVLVLFGEVTGNSVGKLSAKLNGIQRVFSGKVAIDLRNTTFIDSHGLGVFIFFYRRLTEEDRELVFLDPPEFITDLFSGSSLDRVFHVITSEEQL
jgi:anti-sigma B factor antagonist